MRKRVVFLMFLIVFSVGMGSAAFSDWGWSNFLEILNSVPMLGFVSPTPDNGSSQNEDYIYVNYSVSDSNGDDVYSVIDMDGSLVGWYRMDQNGSVGENATHVLDWSGSGNNGTLVGATWSSGGKFGGVYEFDDDGDAVNVDSVSSISTRAYWSDNGTDWNHIVVTDDGSYVNGVLKCSSDMAYIDKLGGYCIDRFEASMPSANSTHMGNSTEVALRNNPGSMEAKSAVGVVPWVSVSQENAQIACSNAGKHLCTSEEWLGAANIQGQVFDLPASLSVAPYGCVVNPTTRCSGESYNGDACNTGYNSSGVSGCYSSEGVFDMTGNIGELVNDSVDYTKPCDPGSSGDCYWNGTGWETSGDVGDGYGEDGVYFQSGGYLTGRAVTRGGHYGSWGTAGPFSSGLDFFPSSTGYLTGFRCCSE